ncbi:MAG: DapH/DapD/GlmU-related protein [Dehalococcoidia bacterium]
MLGRKLQVGENVFFGANTVLLPPDFARFSKNVAVGRGFHLEANVAVGPDVLFSSHVAIIGNDHSFDDPSSSIYWQGRNEPSIVYIEGDNLIGFRTTIIGNVRIGKGCIVGACSVVTTDLPPNTVCVGAPARPVRPRFRETTSESALNASAQ